MSIRIGLTTGFCLVLMVLAAAAQDKTPNFGGDWKLDTAKSDLGERTRIVSMTMKVTQTEAELIFERTVKREERDGAGMGGGMGRGMGRGMGGGMGGGGKQTFDLSGKETSATGEMGGSAKLKAKTEKEGRLKLITMRSFETQMGSMLVKTVESWQLSEDGKTLTITSDTETPRGNRSAKMVFVKSGQPM